MYKDLKRDKGFTLFIAIVIMGSLLLITTGIVNLAVRHSVISQAGRESQYAFYAADTGVECALYWDINNPSGSSAFSTTTQSTIDCNKDGNNPGNEWNDVGGNPSSTFTIYFEPDPFCATVTVTKVTNLNWPFIEQTIIESKGHNTCDLSNPRRVERAIRASY